MADSRRILTRYFFNRLTLPSYFVPGVKKHRKMLSKCCSLSPYFQKKRIFVARSDGVVSNAHLYRRNR